MATVAEQWYQVAENAEKQIVQLTGQLATLEDQIRSGQGNRFALTGQRATIIRQIQELERTASEAKQNGFKALEAEKSGATTEPPTGSSPNADSEGSNTEVQTTPATQPVPEVQPDASQDESAKQADQNAGFTYDPVTGEMVPGDSAYADALRTPPAVELSDEEILARQNPGGLSDEEILARQAALLEYDPTPKSDNKIIPRPPEPKDWRVRISLAKGSNYLYNYGDAALRDAGILEPLRDTGGVIFPYTPSISVSYNAKYDTQTITHSNYNIHNYTGSSVDQVSVSGDFTAQDTTEAAYMLAVIHFFRSATKMFYGKDQNPNRGTPPPLLYLSGHGNYQFDNHPMVLTNFAYSLPVDVDYINAYPDGSDSINSIPLAPFQQPNTAKPSLLASGIQRLTGSGLQPGGMCKKPVFQNRPAGADVVTRVPTKITISLTFLPVVTRNAITNHFSLKNYATGKLLRGSQNPGTGGGIW